MLISEGEAFQSEAVGGQVENSPEGRREGRVELGVRGVVKCKIREEKG